MTAQLDMNEVGAFAEQVAGTIIGGATTAMMVLGDQLGLYAALARSGAVTSAALSEATGTSERYVREWLAQQAAVGVVEYDAAAATFLLSPVHAAVLATDDSPASMIGAAGLVTGMHRVVDRLAALFRSGQGLPWGDQDPVIFESTERFFRVGYRNSLISEWVPAVEGLAQQLEGGASVADVGCGHGAALILMAQAYPNSRFVGFDAHAPSVHVARQRAMEAGVSDRVTFEVEHCHGYPADGYDLITFFDSLHDLGDPVGAAQHAWNALGKAGRLMLVEPLAADDLATTIATIPTAALNYAASTFLCTPNSLSQPVGLALGAQAGESRLRDVLHEAGFAHIRKVAQTPFNMVLEAAPRTSP